MLELRGGLLMSALRSRIGASSLALLLFVAACGRDPVGPRAPSAVLGDLANVATPPTVPSLSADLHVLRQAATAPALETYQISFWACRDAASTITVNYLPAAGASAGQPFLRFDIPRGGLLSVPTEWRSGPLRLGQHDSVRITLTIDPATFAVQFAPTGLVFSRQHPATLAIWYGNADPDLNGDGVVNSADQALENQLAVWVRESQPAPWRRLSSVSVTGQWISTLVPHFSEYAVSW
jgi:hypothetical protein